MEVSYADDEQTRAALVTSALAAWPQTVWAQGVVGSQVPGGAPSDATQSGAVTTIAVVALLLGVLVALGALIEFLDLKRKREGEAVVVQADLRMRSCVTRGFSAFRSHQPRASPLWKGTPVTVGSPARFRPTTLARP